MSRDTSAGDRTEGQVPVVRRAFAEFLGLPAAIVGGFLVLAGVMHALDEARISWLEPVRDLLQRFMFQSPAPTRALLAQVTGSMITATSVTLSLLLLAAQQTASSFTPQALDQFIERRVNQVFFGLFVGVSLYSLLTLATASPSLNPVLGAAVLMVLVMLALFFLVGMIYVTVDQMRPANIVEAIHDHALTAWERHVEVRRRTRRQSTHRGPGWAEATARSSGYVIRLDLDRLAEDVRGGAGEVELVVSLGSYVALGDAIARVRAGTDEEARRLADIASGSFTLDRVADIDVDPGYAVRELVDVAWTSVSTARHHPSPGMLTVHALRDLLNRWMQDERLDAEGGEGTLPVVYNDDVLAGVIDAFTHLAVVASESMMPQTFAVTVDAVARSLPVARPPYQERLADTAVRIVSALGDLVLTRQLDDALTALASALRTHGFDDEAQTVDEATSQMRRTIGSLASRGTRASIARSAGQGQDR